MINTNNFGELQARPELIVIIEDVARDKGIAIEEVFDAMESAIKKVASSKYGNLRDIRVKINRQNGSIGIYQALTVVEELEDPYQQITLEEARQKLSEAEIGDVLTNALPPVSFERGFVQPFRQIVSRKVKEAEKEREYELYKDKVGEIVSGVVKRVELGNVFVELANKAEAFMRKDNCIPRERIDVGDRIRALIYDVKKEIKSSQIMLSRTNPEFIKKLFAQEISEVYDGVIEIKAISRESGSRSKVAVISKDSSLDAVGACIGFKGQRIQGILAEIKGEKIDVVHWSENIATFVINALYPSEVLKVVVDEDRRVVEAVVKDENLSLAIGRGGQNINLISKLVGWHIDLMNEDTEKEKRQTEMQERVSFFKEALDVDDIISQLLVIEGFKSVEDVIEEKVASLASIPAFSEEIISELKSRGASFLKAKEDEFKKQIKTLGISEDLQQIEGLSKQILIELGQHEIKTVNDLAELSTYDLLDILPKGLVDFKKAESLILLARESWEE